MLVCPIGIVRARIRCDENERETERRELTRIAMSRSCLSAGLTSRGLVGRMRAPGLQDRLGLLAGGHEQT